VAGFVVNVPETLYWAYLVVKPTTIVVLGVVPLEKLACLFEITGYTLLVSSVALCANMA